MSGCRLFLALVPLFIIINSQLAVAVEKQIPQSKEEMQLSFAPLVKKAAPAVVNVYTKKKVQIRNFSPFFSDPIFKHFFGNSISGGTKTERIESSLGSGIIVSEDGMIITNNHVIAGAEEIMVVLSDRREFDAIIELIDEKTDLAILRIDAKDEKFEHLKLGDSDSLEVGDLVLAIGNPFGVGQTVTSGIVSALARTTVGISDYQFFIQTDASINPGNSGGALINSSGDLVGINTAIFSKSGGSQGIGFAIPSNMAKTVIRSSISSKRVIRPWLGVSTQNVTQDIANAIGLKSPVGALVKLTSPKGIAAKSGIIPGDVIIAVDNHEIIDAHALHFRIATYDVGSSAMLKIIREGKVKTLPVKMLEAPEIPVRDIRFLKGQTPLGGATIANLSPALADELGVDTFLDGVVITRLRRGIASTIGFHQKDIIRKVNSIEIKSSSDLEKALDESLLNWKIEVQRGNRVINIIWRKRG
ncbi:Do family serine endopeptidase [Rickettsiales bacterium]|nr:Do family serine endopeptidase [Rickettsiales bacterium]